ncbi:hypothetical protein [Puniceibacterium sediminis]|uniref:Lipoprotein n=1 Tax=Puniceibacterium sediminis TaxID=1608407 RepID=A0A238UTT3_9RHOB|nr:hypothetical protein [Puniceibacterium sediminis]SNR25532.1 hypothetical protein SAMN06265370_101118 [Puniceibacterium sediminis]
MGKSVWGLLVLSLLAACANGNSGTVSSGAVNYVTATPDETLPYGQIARFCGAPGRDFGTRVATYPKGRPAYALFDSEPGTSAARSFFLTGFDDGCARQFTAAFAIFSAPSDYEQLRYGLPSDTVPRSRTDAAYEALKSRICAVAKGLPCGSRIGRLERNTAFLSIYENFGSNPRWKTVLVHDGAALAMDLKGD